MAQVKKTETKEKAISELSSQELTTINGGFFIPVCPIVIEFTAGIIAGLCGY